MYVGGSAWTGVACIRRNRLGASYLDVVAVKTHPVAVPTGIVERVSTGEPRPAGPPAPKTMYDCLHIVNSLIFGATHPTARPGSAAARHQPKRWVFLC
jgi:hypothetical protein